MNFFGKRVVVVGDGISGSGAMAAIKAAGATGILYRNELDLDNNIDLVVVSPGIPTNNQVFKIAKKNKIPLIGEIELGYLLCDKPIVAITGTNGKTTITELIGKILQLDKRRPLVCGNIGVSFSSAVMENNYDIAVVEVSSFQLETIKEFRPDIAIISNITEDHLDRHKTMASYIKAKLNIAKNQTKNDYLIIQPNVIEFIKEGFVKSKISYVDRDRITDGCYSFNNDIFYKGKHIAYVDDIRLKGEHNTINAMIAISACKILGVSDRAIRQGIKQYEPRAYRIAFTAEHKGKMYYNDSKGTNIDACLCACKTFNEETCLILGGSDKGYSFDGLFSKLPKNIVKIFAIGETRNAILESAKLFGYDNIESSSSIRDAVFAASELQVKNVLLSPAAASFDSFENYEHRGRVFDAVVKELIEKNND